MAKECLQIDLPRGWYERVSIEEDTAECAAGRLTLEDDREGAEVSPLTAPDAGKPDGEAPHGANGITTAPGHVTAPSRRLPRD